MSAVSGVLALMGSGETSPTMVTPHRRLAARLGPAPSAVILETPYGFQVNTPDISRRAREYFERSVGLATIVAEEPDPSDGPACARLADQLRAADWVFTGPGSPTYALERWAAVHVGAVLAERVRRGTGVTLLASAAACTAGFAALPVYEIYKAGHTPRWLGGLDVLGRLGLHVAVIPHYDNAEGGTYDTRFCYLGEDRLARLERTLPADSAVLGIDEHTAVVFDLASSAVEIWGRGALTVRRRGESTILPAGTDLTSAQLRELVEGTGTVESIRTEAAVGPGPTDPVGAACEHSPVTLPQAVQTAQARAAAARQAHDAAELIAAILDLESTIAAWAGDTEEDQGVDWARGVLRELVQSLGAPVGRGLVEPRRTLESLIGPLAHLRRELRAQGAFDAADRIREALAAAGVSLRDGNATTTWAIEEPGAPLGAVAPRTEVREARPRTPRTPPTP
jgi:hypothetical protein